jgi:hypothetical protein
MSERRFHEHSPGRLAIATIGMLLIGVAVCAVRGIAVGALSTGVALIGFSLIIVWNDDFDAFYWERRRKVAGIVGFVLIAVSVCIVVRGWLWS